VTNTLAYYVRKLIIAAIFIIQAQDVKKEMTSWNKGKERSIKAMNEQ